MNLRPLIQRRIGAERPTMSESRPSLRWGRTKLGPKRVYWVVFSRGSEGETLHGDGYEADIAAAERTALAVMDRVNRLEPGRYKVSLQRKSAFAARRPKKVPVVDRRRPQAKSDRALVRAYLYTYDDPSFDKDQSRRPCWNAHPILKQTAKRVWVHPRSVLAEELDTVEQSFPPLNPGEAALVLDRQDLQREGRASNRRHSQSAFYLKPEPNGGRPPDLPVSVRTHQALALLGLTWPCDSEDLKATYRRRSKEVHPDVGGSPEEFRRLQAAYEHVSRLV